jgi:antirestriction protein ArdC
MSEAVPSRFNVYASVTEKIAAAIEAGAGSFMMPWHAGIAPIAMPLNAVTSAPYRGINVIALWAEAAVKRYVTGYWASYRQWQDIGAQVRRNERGATIVFFKKVEKGDDEALDEEQPRFVARAYRVFNSYQVDGWQLPLPEKKSQIQTNKQIEAFVKATGADVRYGGLVACYRHDLDCIEMPAPERFVGTDTSSPTESYYAVLLHELTHLSGAPHRLNRVFGRRYGDEAYAFEELVAELGSAFLCSIFGITNEPRYDHAAYVSSWLDILGSDNKAIFQAASHAQKAVEYLTQLATSKNRREGANSIASTDGDKPGR